MNLISSISHGGMENATFPRKSHLLESIKSLKNLFQQQILLPLQGHAKAVIPQRYSLLLERKEMQAALLLATLAGIGTIVIYVYRVLNERKINQAIRAQTEFSSADLNRRLTQNNQIVTNTSHARFILKVYEQAAKQGNPEAALSLARFYHAEGWEQELKEQEKAISSYEKAILFYRQSILQHSPYGVVSLSQLYTAYYRAIKASTETMKIKNEEFIRDFQDKADQGDLNAVHALAICHEIGFFGLTIDLKQAISFYRQCVQQESPPPFCSI